MSIRPMPWAPARGSAAGSPAATVTGLAVERDRDAGLERDDDLVGVARDGRVRRCTRRRPRSGAFQMSSRKPVSTARPQTFWSMEYGFFLVVSIGSACFSSRSRSPCRGSARGRGPGRCTSGRARARRCRPRSGPGRCPCRCSRGRPSWRRAAGRRATRCLTIDRAGQRRDQRVAVHVQRVRLDRRQAVLVGELVAGVGDVRPRRRRSRGRAGG